ncbi:polysaccharide deacetylase family protein [Rhizobiaceae bacterium n13]|uniref:Chitooligosaccharide deacetylase n=1 Tax=Ferirhizobium litorale TaxID=2927786 RepID=A0AAE3U0Q0_9HYPH|nr:polysaccharide deacetylase family protein [Fererhizobium litorale]MDI7861434.1 polysaccharide deacetylase family protein [Fererhizobium litorale]MDI7921581.1 polysaccharide deacetylase family protein [Fererhizobium litorale]
MVQALKIRLRQTAKRAVISGGLEAAWLMNRLGAISGARGRGAIFTLHHVRPKDPRSFAPNAHLEITPEFLALAIEQLQAEGYAFVKLSEIPALLADRARNRPFAAFTLDDGYRNNAEFALPVFERYGVPFTVFVSRGFAERTHTIWWETLGELLSVNEEIAFDFGRGPERMRLYSPGEKQLAFIRIADTVIGDDEADVVTRLDETARRHGVNGQRIAARLTMAPDELAELARHPLASLGAHTISHRALAFLDHAEAVCEMRQSADYVEDVTGRRPATLAYPYGDARSVSPHVHAAATDAGFSLAVTTRPGTLADGHLQHLTALPRISLNGYYQKRRHVEALASGIPFRLLGEAG